MMKLTDSRAYRRQRTGRHGGRDHVRIAGSSGFGVGGRPSREGPAPLRAAPGRVPERHRRAGPRRIERPARPGRASRAPVPPVAPSPATRSRPRCARGRSRPFPPTTWPPGGPSWLPCSVPPPDVAGPPVRLDHAGTLRQDQRKHAGQDAAFTAAPVAGRSRASPPGSSRPRRTARGRAGSRAGPARRSRPSATGGSAPERNIKFL